MSQSTLVKSLPIVAKALGRNMGVRVELDAGRPRTDGNVIYLPSLPLEDPGVETLGLGFIIHEAGHIRYSDFSIDYRKLKPIVAKLTGVMEDIRMEQCIIRDYPGASKKLQNLVQKLVQDGFFSPINSDAPAAAALSGYLLYTGRARVLGQSALDDYALGVKTVLEGHMTKLAITRINSVMARISQAKNEGDIVELAHEIAQILKEESERPTPPQNSDQSQQNAGGDPQDQSDDSDDDQDQNNGDGDSDDNDDQTDDDATDDDDNSSSQSTTSSDDTSDDQSDASNGSTTSNGGEETQDDIDAAKQSMKDILATTESESNDLPGDISDAFEQLIKEEIEEAAKSRGNSPVSMKPSTIDQFINPNDHQKSLDDAQAATAELRSRLVQLVQSQTKVKRKTSRHGRRLNDRKIHRIKSGNLSVFQSSSRKKAVNTAVQILLDVSYSMDESMEVATRSTLSLTAAMKKVPNLSVGSAIFPGRNDSAVTVLTRHDQSIEQTAGYYPRLSASGSTPLLPALIWSGDNLVAQKEERKILFVVTDGAPDQLQDCVELIKDLRQGGIEIYGIGMGLDSKLMSYLFGNDYVLINGVNELAAATFTLLERTVLAA